MVPRDTLVPVRIRTLPGVLLLSLALGAHANLVFADNPTYHEMVDAESGLVKARVPLPSEWQLHEKRQDHLSVSGPNVSVYSREVGPFVVVSNSFDAESASLAGVPVAPMMSVEDYLNQQYGPNLQSHGYSLISSYRLPDVTRVAELVMAGMPQTGTRRSVSSMGAEWQHANGTRLFTVLQHLTFAKGSNRTWSVTVNELITTAESFYGARDSYRYALAGTDLNPQYQIYMNNKLIAWLRRHNEQHDARMRQSAIAHAGRMNAILARGATSNNIAKINSDILDISHQGYLQRSEIVTAGQANTVRAMAGQSVIHNPQTNEFYQVDSTSTHHWVGANGEWFGTEDALYDPRRDPALNGTEWSQFEVVR